MVKLMSELNISKSLFVLQKAFKPTSIIESGKKLLYSSFDLLNFTCACVYRMIFAICFDRVCPCLPPLNWTAS